MTEGAAMPVARDMAGHPGLKELRVRDAKGIVRVFYYVAKGDMIYILHLFRKESQKTPKHEEAEVLSLKGSAIARLDKERRKRDMNNAQFSEFLEIPKSRWSSILNNPNKVSVDYLVGLLVKCGVKVKLTLRAA